MLDDAQKEVVLEEFFFVRLRKVTKIEMVIEKSGSDAIRIVAQLKNAAMVQNRAVPKTLRDLECAPQDMLSRRENESRVG